MPHDGIQGPQIVTFVAGNLNAEQVVVIDSQDDYSLPLASAITRGLRGARSSTVSRESVSADDTDFSSIVANVGNDVDVVVFATQVASAANTLSNQLREQGKNAVVFGTDGAYSPSQFKPRRGYVSVFAPDPHFDPGARRLIREYNRYSKNKSFGAFGPATYMAGLVAMNAIEKACDDGTSESGRDRPGCSADEHPVDLRRQNPVLQKGDPLPTRFVIYRINNGKYAPVG